MAFVERVFKCNEFFHTDLFLIHDFERLIKYLESIFVTFEKEVGAENAVFVFHLHLMVTFQTICFEVEEQVKLPEDVGHPGNLTHLLPAAHNFFLESHPHLLFPFNNIPLSMCRDRELQDILEQLDIVFNLFIALRHLIVSYTYDRINFVGHDHDLSIDTICNYCLPLGHIFQDFLHHLA